MTDKTASGNVIVVSGPSGSGKSTLVRRALERLGRVGFSVSWTTRRPRPGEVEGRDYHFVDRKAFRRGLGEDAFLEYAEVHGEFYGTPLAALELITARGDDALLDIDVQGAARVRRRLPGAVSVFIVPPALAVLEARLRERHTESEIDLARRMDNARGELARAAEFDYILVNDDLNSCYGQLEALVVAERQRSKRMMPAVAALLEERRP